MMNARIVNIILSDNDLQGFEVTMVVDENTTQESLMNYVMEQVSNFLIEHNLLNITERLFSKTLHIHGWKPSEIYMETNLNYYICTGCDSEDMLKEEQEFETIIRYH